jgi:hypothetical protein
MGIGATGAVAGTKQDCQQHRNLELQVRACSDIIGRNSTVDWAYVTKRLRSPPKTLTAFGERHLKGGMEALRHLGTPEWFVRAMPTMVALRIMLGRRLRKNVREPRVSEHKRIESPLLRASPQGLAMRH